MIQDTTAIRALCTITCPHPIRREREIALKIHVRLLIVSFLAAATSLQAATYIVPTDRDLVMRSEAIVIATAVTSHSEITRDGCVVTIATLAVDEVFKGDFGNQRTIDLVEAGGAVGNRVTFISGSPRYAAGKQYLVFLRRTPDGWATYGFGLGQFQYSVDPSGDQVLTRGIGEAISGWDEIGNASHVERVRDAIAFEAFVKTLSAKSGAPARSDYFLQSDQTLRVASGFAPKPDAAVPGGLDGVSAISAATSNWNGAGAGVNYRLGVANPNATGGLSTLDHITAVLFNDPANLLPPGVAAAGGVSDVTSGSTSEVDVVVGKNFSMSQSTFNAVMTHELGHTLGLRHSDQDTFGNPCVSFCTSNAIMNSTINVLILQQWDLDAIRTVYAGKTGTGVPADYLSNTRWASPSATFDYCFAPTISGQPSNKSIVSGSQTTLTVAAAGTSAAYQWYIGTPPTTTTTAPNGTSSSLTVTPPSTTTYWVQVTACGAPLNSNPATVTVTTCTPPSAQAPLASPSSIASGQSSTLTENATGSGPLTYQWFSGGTPSTGAPIGGVTSNNVITVSPSVTTQYSVRVFGACTPNSDSATTTVTVAACVPPSASAPFASPSSIPQGQSSSLSVSPTGTGPFTYQWYIGTSPNTSSPIGANSAFLTVTPAATTSYWVRINGQCAPAFDSASTTVTVTCAPISGSPVATPSTINNGQSSTLNVTTNGTGPFTFQWYRGNVGDTSTPIAATQSTLVSPTVTTGFWVRVTAPCGSQDASVVVFVSGTVCTAPTIAAQPASTTINAGAPVTLTVVAGGTAPFTFQWFVGDKGDTANPITGATNASLTQSPSVTAKYWVRVTNNCSSVQSADSNTAIVTIGCSSPFITTQPANTTAPIGTAATLHVTGAGNGLHYQWFQGAKGDTSKPYGTDSATFVTGAISGNTSYWVRITGACGSPVDSNAGLVTAIAPPRTRAARH